MGFLMEEQNHRCEHSEEFILRRLYRFVSVLDPEYQLVESDLIRGNLITGLIRIAEPRLDRASKHAALAPAR
jgi:hypothetical protein